MGGSGFLKNYELFDFVMRQFPPPPLDGYQPQWTSPISQVVARKYRSSIYQKQKFTFFQPLKKSRARWIWVARLAPIKEDLLSGLELIFDSRHPQPLHFLPVLLQRML